MNISRRRNTKVSTTEHAIHSPNKSFEIGKRTEHMAQKFLCRKGYSILKNNYRIRGGEIDIIAKKNGILVFVEVKGRNITGFGEPLEAITWKKKQSLLRSVKTYLSQNPTSAQWRIDVITILFISPKVAHIKHYHNIFLNE